MGAKQVDHPPHDNEGSSGYSARGHVGGDPPQDHYSGRDYRPIPHGGVGTTGHFNGNGNVDSSGYGPKPHMVLIMISEKEIIALNRV